MKAIMISIQPQWVEKILNGKKMVEIRKTMPKDELPLKVYIYCTKDTNNKKKLYKSIGCFEENSTPLNGKVIAEFTLNKIEEYDCEYSNDKEVYQDIALISQDEEHPDWFDREIIATNENEGSEVKCKLLDYACMTFPQLGNYLGEGWVGFYAWYIDDLKIYDKPKELSEFRKPCKWYYNETLVNDLGEHEVFNCFDCCLFKDLEECDGSCLKLTRPFQSWGYVEELEEIEE